MNFLARSERRLYDSSMTDAFRCSLRGNAMSHVSLFRYRIPKLTFEGYFDSSILCFQYVQKHVSPKARPVEKCHSEQSILKSDGLRFWSSNRVAKISSKFRFRAAGTSVVETSALKPIEFWNRLLVVTFSDGSSTQRTPPTSFFDRLGNTVRWIGLRSRGRYDGGNRSKSSSKHKDERAIFGDQWRNNCRADHILSFVLDLTENRSRLINETRMRRSTENTNVWDGLPDVLRHFSIETGWPWWKKGKSNGRKEEGFFRASVISPLANIVTNFADEIN